MRADENGAVAVAEKKVLSVAVKTFVHHHAFMLLVICCALCTPQYHDAALLDLRTAGEESGTARAWRDSDRHAGAWQGESGGPETLFRDNT